MDHKVETFIRERCCSDGAWTGRPNGPVSTPATGAEIAHGGARDGAEAFAGMKDMVLGGLDG